MSDVEIAKEFFRMLRSNQISVSEEVKPDGVRFILSDSILSTKQVVSIVFDFTEDGKFWNFYTDGEHRP